MKGKLKLHNPIIINGKNVKNLSYDTNEITAQMFAEADTKKMIGNSMGAKIAETDYSLHLYLGFAAIIAVNPEIDFTDLERMKGVDVSTVMRLGRNFITETSEEISGPNNSEVSSEDMPNATIAQ